MGVKQHRTAVLFDPHPLWLDAVESILRSVDVSVVGRTTSPGEAVELVAEHRPDVLVCELDSGGQELGGSALIRSCRTGLPELRVVVLAASRDHGDIDAAFAAGALAYAVKTAHAEDVAATVRQAFDHTIFLAGTNGNGAAAALDRPRDGIGLLTRREREILGLAAEGYSNRELARMLWVTEQTVKFHLSNVYRKLDVANRTEASRWAHTHGLISNREARA